MEGGDLNVGNGIGGSRWNPTKEQINMLENLYKQGVRTPSAEQIQQITIRLREFGHIEGKNVFYWFQNHKARQRQKQKQENYDHNIAYFNRFLHFPQFQNNVVCSPCYVPPTPNEFGFYQQYPKVPLPTAGGGFKRREIMEKNKEPTCTQRYNKVTQETLELFPVHPTGILQSAKNGIAGSSSENNEDAENNGNSDYPFFDFFCGN